jgi:thiol-disulfide isomerase/thioredoxin
VRDAVLADNEITVMKKSSIIALFAFTLVAIALTGWAAVRVFREFAAGGVSAAAKDAGSGAQNDADGDKNSQRKIIRLVSNPSPMPPFLVNDLDGNLISTATLHGKIVLLAFWATWCPPCREEIPELNELAKRYANQLVVIGVSQDDGPSSDVREFAKKVGMHYPIVMGSREMSDEYGGVPALPTTFVVNADGGVVQKHMGLYPIEVYDSEIRALLKMPVDAKIETFEDTGQIFLKNAAHATELPGVDFKSLSPDQKRAALKRMNSENCTCGCNLTIAQCRINDSTCATSQKLAENIVKDVRDGKPAPTSQAIHR